MALDFSNPEDMFKGLEQLKLLVWHECPNGNKRRHGIIRDYERFDKESQSAILKAIRYNTGSSDHSNIWLDKETGGVEFIPSFYAYKKRGNKPWFSCGQTMLFQTWQNRESTNETLTEQFDVGDEVEFEYEGEMLRGLVTSKRKRVTITVKGRPFKYYIPARYLRKV